jgi:hypothetical protein
MKKLLSVIVTIIMIFSMSSMAFAVDARSISQNIFTNEYDYIVGIQKLNDKELNEIGLSKSDVEAIVSDFYTGLVARGSLSEEMLAGYGYSDEQIAKLKKQEIPSSRESIEALFTDEQLRDFAGTCTGVITSTYLTGRFGIFKYNWSWDHCPIITLTDSTAVHWMAKTSGGFDLDVTKFSDDTVVKYYYNSTYMFQRTGTEVVSLAFDSFELKFPMTETFTSSTGLTETAYAKEGYIQVSVRVEPEVTNDISYLKVAAVYGHRILGIGEPTLSIGGDGITISFTGSITIDNIADHKVKISIGNSAFYPIVTTIS